MIEKEEKIYDKIFKLILDSKILIFNKNKKINYVDKIESGKKASQRQITYYTEEQVKTICLLFVRQYSEII